MKRILSFVLSALLAVTFTTASAQQNIFVWKNGGNLAVKSAANVDSLTFEVGSWLFKISTSAATSITTDELQATARVAFADNVKSLSKNPEIGVCFSSEDATPTYEHSERTRLGTSVKDYNFTLYELDPGTTYNYRTYVKLEDEVFYGDVKTITTFGEKPEHPAYTIINGHKFIDLGLPSGLLWAKTNVGASSSFKDGDYFAWGETEPKSDYYWSTYKWGSYLSKYNYRDGKTTLEAEDDAATVNWGEGCRMPSCSEFEELCNKCDLSWQSDYKGSSVSGYLVTGPNGNSIFLPAGNYWSSSLSSSYYYAYRLFFYHSKISPSDYGDRYYGFPVRPVAEK